MADAPDGGLLGVIGGPDPRQALERAGHRVVYADDHIALAGTVSTVGVSAHGLVVGGRGVIDGHDGCPWTVAASAWSTGGPTGVIANQGMYGCAVYERDKHLVTLLRDPLGERTIYYSNRPASDGSVWFSDRLNVLRQFGAISSDISLEALRDYLIFAYVPGTKTMFSGANELAPGRSVSLAAGKVGDQEVWWRPEEQHADRTMDENSEVLRHLLTEAVDSRRPPGPVGVYLSGGVDSSAITALLCRQSPDDVHTFAIHFGSDLPNELSFVNQVVDHCRPGTHHEIELTAAELTNALPDTMAALDDPIGDPLTVPNLALGRRASEVVGTVFNGEGGDPVFGGPKNQPMLLAALYHQGTADHQGTVSPQGTVGQAFGASASIDAMYLRSYQKCFDDLDRLLLPEIRAALVDAPPPTAQVSPYLSNGSMDLFVNRLFEANTRLKGSDHILTKVANLTGAAGLIGRSPLFDRRVVEAAFAMPPAHKLEGTIEKAVLKRSVADLLPTTIIDRPKAGMRVPVQTWFRGPLRRQGSKQLLSRKALVSNYLDRSTIKEWTRYDGDPKGRYGRKLWLLLSLEQWLQAHS